MTKLYLFIGLATAFSLSTEVGYLTLAIVALDFIHKKLHSHKH